MLVLKAIIQKQVLTKRGQRPCLSESTATEAYFQEPRVYVVIGTRQHLAFTTVMVR